MAFKTIDETGRDYCIKYQNNIQNSTLLSIENEIDNFGNKNLLK